MKMVEDAAVLLTSPQSLHEEDKKNTPSSLSPQYKSSWNDVNIQGDYDQYARSVTSSRLTNNEGTPSKLIKSPSPRLQELIDSSNRTSSKRGRVKLNKMSGQVVRPMPGFTNGKVAPKTVVAGNVDPESDVVPETKPEKSKFESSSKDKHEITLSTIAHEQRKNFDKTTTANTEATAIVCIDVQTLPSKRKTTEQKASDRKEQTNYSGSRNSVKSNSEFTPPIVTAVDFREPSLTQAVKFATKNGLLVESPDLYSNGTQDGNVSRMSTILMASYLGMGYPPNPNLITSINVKQILPPLHPKNKPIIRRNRVLKRRTQELSETPNPALKSDVTASKNNDKKKLAPLRDSYLYKWKHDSVSRHSVKEATYRLPPRNDDIENIFDQIVRWRSKARHCGKPAMYRRITSPTLGEVALRRKLTDRLPTRQIRKVHLESSIAPEKEKTEERKGARSKPFQTSVKQFIKERLRDAQKDGSMTSPTVIEGFYDVTTKMKQTSLRRRIESNNEILKLPFPDLSLRKRQPVWQRMK